MTTLKVNIDVENNTISVYNNGKGIPVQIHKKEKIYVPELIFGHLLTSSNYNDSDKKVTGGRNGYGAKLCNIFSTEFIVETADCSAGSYYKQTFKNNMSVKSEPVIKNYAKEDFTRITFKPDLKKFKMTHMDQDVLSLFIKRVYDLAGIIRGIKVYINDERIQIKSFNEYVQLYLKGKENAPVVYEKVSDRWEVCFTPSDGQFQQVTCLLYFNFRYHSSILFVHLKEELM
jgi:DNA topoisomerase-2